MPSKIRHLCVKYSTFYCRKALSNFNHMCCKTFNIPSNFQRHDFKFSTCLRRFCDGCGIGSLTQGHRFCDRYPMGSAIGAMEFASDIVGRTSNLRRVSVGLPTSSHVVSSATSSNVLHFASEMQRSIV